MSYYKNLNGNLTFGGGGRREEFVGKMYSIWHLTDKSVHPSVYLSVCLSDRRRDGRTDGRTNKLVINMKLNFGANPDLMQ